MAQFNDFAILCGKSKQCIHAPGSRYFREVIESNVEQYQQAPDKFSKMKVTKEIYDNLKVRYRFLKHNESTDSWEELTGLQARDKIGHSLRFACRASKKRKPKRCTKRVQSSSSVGSQQSTSNSSTDTDCSSDNNTSDSIVELFRQPVLAPNPMVMQEPVVTSEVSSDRYSRLMENAQGIYKSPHADHFSIDDLMVMLQTDDIVSAVKNLDFEDNNHGNFQNGVPARRGSGNLMSLLLDPVGEF